MNTTHLKLASLAWLLTPTLCLAWGYDGHRIVGEIASNYLSPCAEEAVKFLLGDQTLADASIWAAESSAASTIRRGWWPNALAEVELAVMPPNSHCLS